MQGKKDALTLSTTKRSAFILKSLEMEAVLTSVARFCDAQTWIALLHVHNNVWSSRTVQRVLSRMQIQAIRTGDFTALSSYLCDSQPVDTWACLRAIWDIYERKQSHWTTVEVLLAYILRATYNPTHPQSHQLPTYKNTDPRHPLKDALVRGMQEGWPPRALLWFFRIGAPFPFANELFCTWFASAEVDVSIRPFLYILAPNLTDVGVTLQIALCCMKEAKDTQATWCFHYMARALFVYYCTNRTIKGWLHLLHNRCYDHGRNSWITGGEANVLYQGLWASECHHWCFPIPCPSEGTVHWNKCGDVLCPLLHSDMNPWDLRRNTPFFNEITQHANSSWKTQLDTAFECFAGATREEARQSPFLLSNLFIALYKDAARCETSYAHRKPLIALPHLIAVLHWKLPMYRHVQTQLPAGEIGPLDWIQRICILYKIEMSVLDG